MYSRPRSTVSGKVLFYVPLALVASCWYVHRPSTPADRGVSLELHVSTFVLANGLRVVVAPDLGDPEVRVTMRYAVGEIDDPPGQAGISHLVEHTLYEPVMDGESLFDRVETDASGFAGYTDADATVYTERAMPDRLDEMLRIEATRLGQRCASVTAGAFQRQLEIVRNELRERDSDDRLLEALDGALYPAGHALHRASFGRPASIAALTQAEVCAFADAHYTPSNAVLVISGEVTAAGVQPRVERAFGAIRSIAAGAGHDARARVLPPTTVRGRTTVQAPVDQPELVLAWPLPADPVLAARVRAVGDMATWLVEARVSGRVFSRVLGAGGARMFAIVIVPSSAISVGDAIDGAHAALWGISQWFSSGLYEHAQLRVLYELLARMAPGATRDATLAEDAARAGDVDAMLRAEVNGLATLSEDGAAELAKHYLARSSSTLVVLKPDGVTPSGRGGGLAHPLLERGPAPPAADPALAHRPAPMTGDENPLDVTPIWVRTLANGLHVVLLPTRGERTVDIRLVFGAGTADELPDERGVAMLTGYGLEPRRDDATDMMKFVLAGGTVQVDVAWDHTTFGVTGLTPYLDQLLLGLDRTVVDGNYDGLVRVEGDFDIARREPAPSLPVELAWRAALYGDAHPYARGGIVQEVEKGAFGAVGAFRSEYYQPDDATLIIAGGFDPEAAERWIEYRFGGWHGSAVARNRTPAALRPLALGHLEDGPLLGVRIAVPAGRDRAAALVAAAMVRETIADVREQLAASYGLRAALAEHRLSSLIEIVGDVDAKRAADACTLLHDRLAKLRDGSPATASLFVAARRHVLAQLRAPLSAPSPLAERAVEDLDLGLDLRARAATADAVAALTVDQLAPLLARIDPSRAAILLTGPRAALVDGFTALDRVFQPAP